ncbi:MAG: sigma-54-dependent Fis family transcriptional regulator [Deltaproteobacteria bacterium]|nr:sigma-54-dependent Fis family transcriptional regulator [Deltaproteobacteria bacterium]
MSRILILDDDEAVLNCFQVLLTQAGRFEIEVLNDSTRARDCIAAGGFDLLLLDMDMPEVSGMEVLRAARQSHPTLEVVVITGVGDVELAVESMKLGAFDYLCKPVDPERLVGCLDRALERSRRHEELSRARQQGSRQGPHFQEAFKEFVTQDPALMQTLSEVERIALSNNSVLIRGESGTGKELVARAVHRLGCRADKPFVAVNASAFASSLFESQFFGHERGAFTGADSAAPGVFEEANGGTLFLDEVGDIELPVQSKLLRVLQSGEYYRLGSTKKRAADVRIISATNKDLEREIEAGRFRRDLYYRLTISTILVPPLRERKGDVELLAYYFLDRTCARNGKRLKSIAEEVMEVLEGHDYPGNLRELENIIASAVVLETGDVLSLSSLPRELRATARERVAPAEVRRTLADMEAEHIRAVMEYTSGNRSAAARILGISRMGLHSKLKRLGFEADAANGNGNPRAPGSGAR